MVKYMKKIISISLVLAMLLSCAVLFASCGGTWQDGNVAVSSAEVAVDLKNCGVAYDAYLSTGGMRQATTLASKLGKMIGMSVRANSARNNGEEESTDQAMILIGDVGYRESNSVLNSMSDNGWTIRAMGNKIVIMGANPFLTRVALAYFVNKYMVDSAFDGSTLTMNESATQNDVGEMPVVDENGDGLYALVYNS